MSEKESAKNKMEEKMLEALLEYAAACHVDNILAEYPVEKGNHDLIFPPEFDRRMKKLFARHNRKEALKSIRKKTIKVLPRAAIFLLVLIGSFTLVVTSVEALRVKALNIIMNIRNQYTSIQIKDENNNFQSKQTKELLPQDWSGYAPSYIPPGFKISRTEKRETRETIYFANEKGQIIRFTRYLSNNTDLRIDTEGAAVQNILIRSNIEALLAEEGGLVTIVWQEGGFLFSLIGETKNTELIKMAESIKN